MTLAIAPIAHIRTPYSEKFAIPRQPGLVKRAYGDIIFLPEFNDPNYLRGIEQFSHLWLIFHFHQSANKSHSALIRPPRLGGNKKLGVWASRSNFRPNNIGMSVVEFAAVEWTKQQLKLKVKGPDLVDGTPILDIKPYVPYADSLSHAQGGFAQDKPPNMEVVFSAQAQQDLSALTTAPADFYQLIAEVLSQDPRPAYHSQSQPDKIYGMTLYNFNIQWQVKEQQNLVLKITQT
ncbi:tRNA (N6-threonylcarbamoyladenosine(37)-N6)-methyltransferase TrmO [Paraglaciecola aestuariivivens]